MGWLGKQHPRSPGKRSAPGNEVTRLLPIARQQSRLRCANPSYLMAGGISRLIP